jgi:hypothetical protein
VVAYTGALGGPEGPMADDRLVPVGNVVSSALFGPGGDPAPEARRWVETTLDEVEGAHPADEARRPGGRRRRR